MVLFHSSLLSLAFLWMAWVFMKSITTEVGTTLVLSWAFRSFSEGAQKEHVVGANNLKYHFLLKVFLIRLDYVIMHS